MKKRECVIELRKRFQKPAFFWVMFDPRGRQLAKSSFFATPQARNRSLETICSAFRETSFTVIHKQPKESK